MVHVVTIVCRDTINCKDTMQCTMQRGPGQLPTRTNHHQDKWGVVPMVICPGGELSQWGAVLMGNQMVRVVPVGIGQWGVVLEPTTVNVDIFA